jgi:ABC-2 type transport system permease protein
VNGLLAARTLWGRDISRFYRDKARLIGALTPPIVFWFVIGTGLGDAFSVPGGPQGLSYLQYFYAGTLMLIVLFTSVFSTISVIEDRHEGFLQAVLVSPAPRLAVVTGKVLGASTVGLLQGLTFLVLAPAAGIPLDAASFLSAAGALALASVGLTGLGFCLAWLLDSTQGFHAVMNLFLIPMWMLSGSLFPKASAPAWLQCVMAANPVSYGVSALQRSLLPAHAAATGAAELGCSFLALTLFAAAMLAASVLVASRRNNG